MGYDVLFHRPSRFFLPKENKEKALDALRRDHSLGCQDARSLPEALFVAGYWRAHEDAEGNVVHLELAGGTLTERAERSLELIAPYVRPGSYVVLEGEDGLIWRWYFDGHRMIEQPGYLYFEDPDGYSGGELIKSWYD